MLIKRSKEQNKYLYIKRGDVANELRFLSNSPGDLHEGPMSYISQFIKLYRNNPISVISFLDKSDFFQSGRSTAYNINVQYPTFFGKVIGRLRVAIATIYHLIKLHPNRILCANDGLPLWICFIYSKLTKTKLVHTRHNSFDLKAMNIFLFPFKKFANSIDRAIINRLPYIIVHGNYLKDQASKIINDSSKIVTFRPSYRKFYNQSISNRNAIKDFTQNGKYKIISYIGRIATNKGPFDLLAAFLELLEKDFSLRLLFIGGGPESKRLKQKIIQTQRNHNIIYLGEIANSQLGSIIFQSKFIVTPTRSSFPEAFCKAAVEPLILGTPVIVPNFGPFPYFVKNEVNGLIFEPNSTKSLKKAICKGLSNTRLYNKLCEGALLSGRSLIDPPLSFTDALQQTLE
jgi:glycosyltransferase involved in cell wall biosynthesis